MCTGCSHYITLHCSDDRVQKSTKKTFPLVIAAVQLFDSSFSSLFTLSALIMSGRRWEMTELCRIVYRYINFIIKLELIIIFISARWHFFQWRDILKAKYICVLMRGMNFFFYWHRHVVAIGIFFVDFFQLFDGKSVNSSLVLSSTLKKLKFKILLEIYSDIFIKFF